MASLWLPETEEKCFELVNIVSETMMQQHLL